MEREEYVLIKDKGTTSLTKVPLLYREEVSIGEPIKDGNQEAPAVPSTDPLVLPRLSEGESLPAPTQGIHTEGQDLPEEEPQKEPIEEPLTASTITRLVEHPV